MAELIKEKTDSDKLQSQNTFGTQKELTVIGQENTSIAQIAASVLWLRVSKGTPEPIDNLDSLGARSLPKPERNQDLVFSSP